MGEGNRVIDAREIFAARAKEAVKYPYFSPNMRYLRELCSSICKTRLHKMKVSRKTPPPPDVVQELVNAISRNVHQVLDCHVLLNRTGWLVVFEAGDENERFNYSLVVDWKWILHENYA